MPIEAVFDERARPWRPPAFTGPRDLRRLSEQLRAGIDGGVQNGPARTAYIFRFDTDASVRLAVGLMKEGYKVALSAKPLAAGSTSYPRGSVVVRVSRNPDTVHERVETLAGRFGVQVDAVHTAYCDEGPTGVGSNPVVTLRFPRVAVLVGEGVSVSGFGHTWYALEREYGLPFTAVRADRLGDLRVSNYDVVVLPPGRGYRRAFGEDGADALREWVRSGGVLIGMAGAAEYLADSDLGFTTARLVGDEEEADTVEETAPSEEELPPPHGATMPPLASPGASESAPLSVPGAIMRASLDLTHPFSFGFESQEIGVLVSGDDFYYPSKEGSNPVAFVGGSLRVAGFVWPENTERLLRGTAWMIDEPLGSGRVVLFADDPNYRLLWPSLSRLLLNAILIGPTVR